MNTLRAKTRETLTAEAILNSPRQLPGKHGAGGTPRQGLLIKEEIQNQMVRLRDAFLREDPRITGTIPRHMMQYVFKAGGMELKPEQIEDARKKFVTGDGRFNWVLFCDHGEPTRVTSSTAQRMPCALSGVHSNQFGTYATY